MNKQVRLARLAELVTERGSLHVDEAVAELGISQATARRDLDELAGQQLIRRTRGGAVANSTSGDVPMRYRSAREGAAKSRIADAVAARVRPGEVVAFNGGTTTTMAAYQVGVRFSAEHPTDEAVLTVVTNAVNIANDLAVRPQTRVLVTGGVVRSKSYELTGPLSELVLPRINVDVVYLGVSAIDLAAGIFTHDDAEAAVNNAFVEAARTAYVVADSSKLRRHSFARICPLESVDGLITDSGADPAALDALRAAGWQVVTV
jgi:DeoR family transcriptional regulator of aga operon